VESQELSAQAEIFGEFKNLEKEKQSMPEEQEFSKGGGTAEELTAQIEARVQSAIEEVSARREEAAPEIAEPEWWWNLWGYGPVQRYPALRPHRVIRVGESFYVATILWFNPWWPWQVSACELLTNLCAEVQVKYCTGDICEWTRAPAGLSATHNFELDPEHIEPGKCWYVDYLYCESQLKGRFRFMVA
jgi:hypothetical protein